MSNRPLMRFTTMKNIFSFRSESLILESACLRRELRTFSLTLGSLRRTKRETSSEPAWGFLSVSRLSKEWEDLLRFRVSSTSARNSSLTSRLNASLTPKRMPQLRQSLLRESPTSSSKRLILPSKSKVAYKSNYNKT